MVAESSEEVPRNQLLKRKMVLAVASLDASKGLYGCKLRWKQPRYPMEASSVYSMEAGSVCSTEASAVYSMEAGSVCSTEASAVYSTEQGPCALQNTCTRKEKYARGQTGRSLAEGYLYIMRSMVLLVTVVINRGKR